MAKDKKEPHHHEGGGNSVRGDLAWVTWRQEVVLRPPVLTLSQSVPYNQSHAIMVPEGPGVYLIHDLRGVLYVGRTTNLARRYREHYWDSHNPLLYTAVLHPVGRLQFSWQCCPRHQLPDQERFLIRTFQPICNSVRYTH